MSSEDLARLVKQLENKQSRESAADQLRKLGPAAKGAVPGLIRLLGSKDHSVRFEAASVLLYIGPDAREAIPPLVAVVKDDDGDGAGSTAAYALGHIGPDALPALADLLQSPSLPVRRSVACALGQLDDKGKSTVGEAAVPVLIQAFKDDAADVRSTALESVEGIGPIGLPKLRAGLGDENAMVQACCAQAIVEMDPGNAKEAIEKLAVLVREPSHEVRARAARALGSAKTQAKTALRDLMEALQDGDREVRYYAARAIGLIGVEAKAAVPRLCAALKDEDEEVRGSAADAIASIGPEAKEAVPNLIQTLGDENSDVRVSAAGALGRIGGAAKQALPALEKVAKDPDGDVRAAARTAAAQIRALSP